MHERGDMDFDRAGFGGIFVSTMHLPNSNANRRPKGLLRLLLAGALSLMVAGLMAVPAQAQTGEILVKNFDKAESTVVGSGLFVGNLVGSNFGGAQAFTTGSSPAGYTITEVTVIFNQFSEPGGGSEGSGVDVSIYTSTAGGIPDSLLYELTSPESIDDDGWNRFTPPENSTLDSGTTYLVVFNHAGGTNYGLVATSSSSEDSGRAAGWRIGNKNLKRTDSSWADHIGGPLYLRIRGTVHNNLPDFGAMRTIRDVEAETPANVNLGAPVTATDHDDDALTYTLGGADTDTFAIDSSTGQIRTRVALPNQRGRYSVTVTADDGNGGTGTVAVTINLFVDDQVQVTNLEARARAGRVIALSWDAPPNSEELDITGYRIEVSTDGAHFEELVPSQDATQYVHNTGFPAGQTLYYRVRTILESLGPRPTVDVVSATTEGDPRVAPSLPALNLVEGGRATHTVALTEQPSGTIRVTHSSDNSDVTVSPTAFTFSRDNWEVPQSVTVQAAQDADDVDDVATVTYRAAGSSYQPSQVRVRVKDNDRPSFGTLEAEFYYTFHLGTVPGVHFGESLEVRVRFSNPLRHRHEITDITGPNGEVLVSPGPELTDLIGPDRGIRVTNGTVESIGILDRRILVLNVNPSGSSDITLTLEPLPCDEPGALCSGSEGLADRVQHTVRAAADPPPTPTDIQQQTVRQGNTEKMKVSFDGTDDATISRVQWKVPDQEWSEAEEFWTWRRAGPEERQWAVTTTVTPGLAYDIRARWESPIGIGPWAYGSREGLPQAQWGETLTWYLVGARAEVRIHYDRDLDRKSRLDVSRSLFDVTYSESRTLGHSVEHVSIIDDDQGRPRVVKLRLANVVRGSGASGADAPHIGERVWVSYARSQSISPQPPGVFDQHGTYAPAFGRLEATLVADLNSPALSVADATVSEAQGATADFEVTLSRAASETVTVEYATIPDGTATEGADYTATSGTLTFNAGETSKTISVPVHDDSHEDSGETFRLMLSNPSGGNAYLADAWAIGTINNDDPVPESSGPSGLTASFLDLPQTHDGSAFTFELAFSEELHDLSYTTLRDSAFAVTHGAVTGVRRLDPPSNIAWEITVEPAGNDDVTVRLGPTEDCADNDAICSEDGRKLSTKLSATVEGLAPPENLPDLTVSFASVPDTHDGTNDIVFRIAFSEEPHDLSYKTLRDSAFAVTHGAVTGPRRLNPPSNIAWEITVEPAGNNDVTVRLGPTEDCADNDAICTEDDRKLSNRLRKVIQGPPVEFSVADAEVTEAEDAVLAFVVTLSRAASGSLTVDYATSDGSAQASVDYTAASGTLTFEAGESSQTIEVGVRNDDHDEAEETLTLTLSNPSSGVVTDGRATGTIKNSDPLPRAMLARFGRAVAVQVVEHVEERLAAPREPGFRGRFAGQELRPGMEREMAMDFLRQLGAAAGADPLGADRHYAMPGAPGVGMQPAPGLAGGVAMPSLDPMSAGADGFNGPGLGPMGLAPGDMLTGSAFALNRETRGGILSFSSRGTQSHFAGRDGDLSLDGRVRTTMLGADYARGPLVAGLSLAHSRGQGGYQGADDGDVASSVTGLYPWLGYQVTDRITLWGVTGYGKGALTLTPGAGTALKGGLSMAMAAGGLRGDLAASVVAGFGLAFKADVLWAATGTEGVDGPAGRLAATEAAVTRFRTGLEASRGYSFKDRLSLEPSLEVGLRRDGGDAETGAGVDLGGGMIVSDTLTGFSADVRVRTLLVHQDAGFSERGLSVAFSFDPTPGTPLGFLAKLTPSWGGEATSGAQALWGRDTMAGMAPGQSLAGNRLEAEFGYGLPVGGQLVGTPRLAIGTSEYGRDYRFGYGLAMFEGLGMGFNLGVDAHRREIPGQGRSEHGLELRLAARW